MNSPLKNIPLLEIAMHTKSIAGIPMNLYCVTAIARRLSGIVSIAILSVAFCAIPGQSQNPIYFEDAIAPIFRKNCVACHNAKIAEGGLNMETPASLLKGGDSGATIDANAIDTSSLLTRPSATDDTVMPPDGNTVGAVRLTPDQINLIKAWIAGGSLSKGTGTGPNLSMLKLPESARASYAIAMSGDNDFIAFGRAGNLMIHNARRASTPTPVEGVLDPAPTQIIENAHPDFIYSIAISPDGKRIATGSTGQVKIWKQMADPIEANRVALEAAGIPFANLVTSSADSSFLAASEPVKIDPPAPAADGTVPPAPPASTQLKLLKRDGSLAQTLVLAEPSVVAAAFAPSNNRFYAVGSSNALYAWDLAAQPIAEPVKTQLPSPVQNIAAIDETTLLISTERKASVWQFKTPAAAELIADHPLANAVNGTGPVDLLAMAPDRSQLVTGSRDDATGQTALRHWDVPQAKLLGVIDRDRNEQLALLVFEREVRRAQAAVDRSNGVVGELDKALQAEAMAVTNAQAAKEKAAQALAAKTQEMQTAAQAIVDHEKAMADAKAAIEAATQKLTQLTTELEPKKKALADIEKQKATTQTAMDNATQALVSTEESQKAAQARLEERKQLAIKQTETVTAMQAVATQRKAAADAVRFSEQAIAFAGKNLLVAKTVAGPNQPNSIDVFSLETRERIDARAANPQLATAASLAAIGANVQRPWQLAYAVDSPDIIVDRVSALSFSPDGSKLAVGSGDPSRSGQVVILNASDEAIAAAVAQGVAPVAAKLADLHSDTVLGLAYSPDGKLLASCGADKMTKLVDTQTNAIYKIFEGHTHHVLALAWQEDGQKLATASSDATVKVWDVERGESIKTIAGYGTEVTAIAYVGSTPNVVTTTLNNLVRMHDSNSGNQVKQFSPAADSLYSVYVSPNGKYAMSAGQEGIARIWYIEDGRLVGEWK